MGRTDFPRRAQIVEDDALTRSLISTLLVVGGFHVQACASSREAHEVFDHFDPDVLVVDIQLREKPNGAPRPTKPEHRSMARAM